ncbi:MAG: hypothetical protein V3T86_05480 [Planctomycetota bacterium]
MKRWILLALLALTNHANAGETTWRERVEIFWKYFEKNAPAYRDAIIDGKNKLTMMDRMSQSMSMGGLARGWNLDRDKDKNVIRVMTSVPRDRADRILLAHWKARAPQLVGWEFQTHIPRRELKAWKDYEGVEYQPGDFRVSVAVRVAARKVDLRISHPKVESRQSVAFQMLSHVLQNSIGEHTFADYIATIEHAADPGDDSLALPDLRKQVEAILNEHQWPVATDIMTAWTVYEQLPDVSEGAARSDVVAGSTLDLKLIKNYAGDREIKGLGEFGATLAYVTLSHERFTAGKQAAQRSAMQDLLDAALMNASAGRVIGGAHGTKNAYIDLVFFDEAAGVPIVKKFLRESDVVPSATLRFFATARRDEAQVLKQSR